jgi:hypothetical protein
MGVVIGSDTKNSIEKFRNGEAKHPRAQAKDVALQ